LSKTGPIVAGAIYQQFRSYNYAYIHGGIACFICAFIQLFYPGGEVMGFIRRKNSKIKQPVPVQ
jgi:hypothetical protein